MLKETIKFCLFLHFMCCFLSCLFLNLLSVFVFFKNVNFSLIFFFDSKHYLYPEHANKCGFKGKDLWWYAILKSIHIKLLQFSLAN